MTLKEAINLRHSRRSYTSEPLPAAAVASLMEVIDAANSEDGLHIQLITNAPKAFASLRKTYGLFSGVHSYLAMVGPAGDILAQQRLGYYGELLILKALEFGLGSCWVGATFDKSCAQAQTAPGEKLYCLITLGSPKENFSLGEKLAKSIVGKHDHDAAQIMTCKGQPPLWFRQGIDAVLRAPSARNRLPVHFTLENGIVSADVQPNNGYEYIDLGIAKLHFEIGADYIFYDLRKSH